MIFYLHIYSNLSDVWANVYNECLKFPSNERFAQVNNLAMSILMDCLTYIYFKVSLFHDCLIC